MTAKKKKKKKGVLLDDELGDDAAQEEGGDSWLSSTRDYTYEEVTGNLYFLFILCFLFPTVAENNLFRRDNAYNAYKFKHWVQVNNFSWLFKWEN